MNNMNLIEMATDDILSLTILKEDVYYRKIPKDKIGYYIMESKKMGQEAAESILNNFPNNSIAEICKEKGVKILVGSEEHDFEIVKLRGKYDSYEKSIELYDLSIKKFEKAILNARVGLKLDYEQIMDILLAHELYHYLEDEELGSTYDALEKVNIFKGRIIKKEYPIIKTSDIAAHIFCKELLSISYHPKVLDYIYLIGTDYTNVENVTNYLNEMNEILHS